MPTGQDREQCAYVDETDQSRKKYIFCSSAKCISRLSIPGAFFIQLNKVFPHEHFPTRQLILGKENPYGENIDEKRGCH